ncbi:MAG: glycosyltransferase [Firmicutes bacterium]|nr:glycosyltransferase [Bacillota bacterium]
MVGSNEVKISINKSKTITIKYKRNKKSEIFNPINNPVNKSLDKLIKKNIAKKNIKRKYNSNIVREPKQNDTELPLGVSIITLVNRQKYINNIFKNYERQSYKSKELILIINKNIKTDVWKERANSSENVKIFQVPKEKNLLYRFNLGLKQAKYDTIARFDDKDFYASDYLINSVNVFKNTDADIVEKTKYYIYFKNRKILAIKKFGVENSYTKYLNGPTILFKKNIYDNLIKNSLTSLELNKSNTSIKIYSNDRNGYACVMEEDDLLKDCIVIAKTDDYTGV